MSGHSKWSTIKRKKGALDAKRSKIFSRISKEITIAAREGGGADPEMNPRLRLAVQNAKAQNMPKDVIERAINKASKDGDSLVEMNFEGYGPGGVAIFVECLSDNNNRTVGAIRAIFTKKGGSLGTNGSLSFIFDRKGVFEFPKPESIEMDDLELEVIDAGAEDIENEGDTLIITCALEDFGQLNKKLEELGITPEKAELQRIPNNTKELSLDDAKKVLRMIEDFEDNDDVQNVFHNLEMTDELEKALNEE
ncbi:YebC/PmpR family DNA-binding transcriptional regulator [Saccharicrinis sp. FJH62]|uniref:YebC/PmpR family DNA-binding transcriptional regulator n=1 Tax=Saccharicrinis sp. FJH62 TaxID=3344657 RepID=UPI0035D4E8D0